MGLARSLSRTLTRTLEDSLWREPDIGALALLSGEPDGFAIDATITSGVGSLAIKDSAANNNTRNNISLYDSTSPLTNAGTSPKLVDKSDGTLEWSPHNLVLASNDFDNATYWTNSVTVITDSQSAPDGTATAFKIDAYLGGPQGHRLSQNVSGLITGAIYTYTARVKAGELSWVFLGRGLSGTAARAFFNVSTGVVGTVNSGVTATIVSVGNGFYEASITFTAAATTDTLGLGLALADNTGSFSADGSGVTVWHAQLNRGPVPTTYLPTTTAAVIGVPVSYDIANSQYGILSEPAATNLQVYSQEFDNAAWTKNNATVTANAVVAPDGTTTADTLTDDTANDVHRAYDAITLATATPATFSVYAKAGTHNYLSIVYVATVENMFTQVFDLSDGSLGESDAGTTTGTITDATITSVGNGWYRCTVTGSLTGANGFFGIAMAGAKTGNTFSTSGYPIYVGTGTTLHLWGAQAETGTVATSYIPTFAATATRAADDVTQLLSTLPFSTTAGSIICYGKSFTGATIVGLWKFHFDGANTSNIYGAFGASRHLRIFDASTVEIASLDGGNVVINTPTKTGAAWADDDFAASVSGGAVATDGAGTIGTNQTKLSLGSGTHGMIYQITYLPRRMTNAELIAETS